MGVEVNAESDHVPAARGPARDGDAAIVTSDGRPGDRSALAAVRALALAGYRPVVATSGDHSLAAASRYAAGIVGVPPPTTPEYGDHIDAVAAAHDTPHVFPSSDAALLALRPELRRLVDKDGLAAAAGRSGLGYPETLLFADGHQLRTDAGDLTFPLVVKPTLKRPGSPPALPVLGPEDLANFADDGPVVAQPLLDGPMLSIAGVAWGGRLVVAVQQAYHRTWPVTCGTASYAVVEPVDERLSAPLADLLADHDGVFQAQFVGGLLIDLNLRVYGSMPLSVAAGANLPAIVCALAAGGPPPRIDVRVGTAYRWIEGDVRHVWATWRSGATGLRQALAALAPRRSTQAHSVVAWRDPQPMLARLRFTVRRTTAGSAS